MKRTDLIRKLEEAGCKFVRHGGNHHWYNNPKTRVSQPVPRRSPPVARFPTTLPPPVTVSEDAIDSTLPLQVPAKGGDQEGFRYFQPIACKHPSGLSCGTERRPQTP